MSSLCFFGLNPLTLRGPAGDTVALVRLTWDPDGQLSMVSLEGGLLAAVADCSMAAVRGGDTRSIMRVALDGVRIVGGPGPPPVPCTVSVDATHGEVQEALGVLLAMAQVGRQAVVRPPGAGLSTRGPRPWWLEFGVLWLRIKVAREHAQEFMDARGNLRQGVGPKIWQRALQAEGAADALCVALALQVHCSISVSVTGDTRGAIFQLWFKGPR